MLQSLDLPNWQDIDLDHICTVLKEPSISVPTEFRQAASEAAFILGDPEIKALVERHCEAMASGHGDRMTMAAIAGNTS
jgi:hypothetical protein